MEVGREMRTARNGCVTGGLAGWKPALHELSLGHLKVAATR